MVPRASIISESEVSTTALCLLCSPSYTAVQINSKSTSVIKVAALKNMIVPCAPTTVWNCSIHCPSLSAMFNLLHSSTNQELLEKHLCNQGSHHEKYGQFSLCKRKPSRATIKSTLFTVNKDKVKPIALAVIELLLSEGISQLVGRSVGWSVHPSIHR